MTTIVQAQAFIGYKVLLQVRLYGVLYRETVWSINDINDIVGMFEATNTRKEFIALMAKRGVRTSSRFYIANIVYANRYNVVAGQEG